jgi:hypothetical protein
MLQTLPSSADETVLPAAELPATDPINICIENGAVPAACCIISRNVALGKVADQSSNYGTGQYPAGFAVDGDLTNFTHTLAGNNGLGPAIWEVDLAAPTAIDGIVLHNRDSCCGSRLRDVIVSVHDISFRDDFALDPLIQETTDVEFPLWEGAAIWESDLLNPENQLGVFPLGPDSIEIDLVGEGVVGQFVRVTRIPDIDLSGSGAQGNADEATVLSLGEVQVIEGSSVPQGVRFVRGDPNSDGTINLTDGIVILNYLFLGAAAPSCMDAADVDDDGGEKPAITDAIRLFGWLYLGGVPPVAPSPTTADYVPGDCGIDPADGPADTMDCATPAAKCSP